MQEGFRKKKGEQNVFVMYTFDIMCSHISELKGTVHEKTFFPGKGALGPSEYESSKKNPIKIKQGAQN